MGGTVWHGEGTRGNLSLPWAFCEPEWSKAQISEVQSGWGKSDPLSRATDGRNGCILDQKDNE